MNFNENCNEIFLESVTDVFVHPMDGSNIPIPFNVAQILSIDKCSLADSVLHIAISGDDCLIADSITAKATPSSSGSLPVYTFEISASLDVGNNKNAREADKTFRGKDFLVVLRKEDGTSYLCYTLPNTFAFQTSANVTQSDESRSITISLKALSDFIPITFDA